MIDPHDVRLLVEGADDGHFAKHFLRNVLQYQLDVKQNGIIACGDSGRLLERFDAIQKETGFTTIGLIADADSNPANRWRAIRSRAGTDEGGSFFLPEEPSPGGTIVTWSKGRRLGVWLMPKPGAAGNMESFLRELLSPHDPQPALWARAVHAVSDLPMPRLFADKDRGKAELRTWLAWQKEPGASFGLALSQGAFNLEHPLALQFRRWLASLLEIPHTT